MSIVRLCRIVLIIRLRRSLFHQWTISVYQLEVVEVERTTLSSVEIVTILTGREYNEQVGGFAVEVIIHQGNIHLFH